ncbi:hypothetical protein [Novilysobacter erysipheiresistens]|uniref:Uncharacterized protein n=1 Tax=Novilysobacter erysipheiresistens TaxID=1749332 RepID=A0ABU7Z1H9_9GAMM
MSYRHARIFHFHAAPACLALAAGTAFALILLAWSSPAAAEVSRCERDDGSTAFTDLRCSEIGAVEREAPRDRTGSRRFYRGGCARNVQDLIFEMSTAIDARDANRLASVYHWAGMSSRTATPVMTRLDALVQRPLVDIVPVLPAPRAATVAAWSGPDAEVDSGFDAVADATGGPAVPVASYRYPSTVNHDPVALRVVQTLDNGSTPSETVFDLHRHFGCVWIKGG